MVEICIHEFHAYKDVWEPITGEVFLCEMEDKNLFDSYAVAIKKGSKVIVHVPCKISAAMFPVSRGSICPPFSFHIRTSTSPYLRHVFTRLL